MKSTIHHYEVLEQYTGNPIASFLNWIDAVAFAAQRNIRCVKVAQ